MLSLCICMCLVLLFNLSRTHGSWPMILSKSQNNSSEIAFLFSFLLIHFLAFFSLPSSRSLRTTNTLVIRKYAFLDVTVSWSIYYKLCGCLVHSWRCTQKIVTFQELYFTQTWSVLLPWIRNSNSLLTKPGFIQIWKHHYFSLFFNTTFAVIPVVWFGCVFISTPLFLEMNRFICLIIYSQWDN